MSTPATEGGHVLVEPGEVTVVTIDRPEKRNAMTVATTQEIARAIQGVGPRCRVIVLTGAGGSFSAGGDFDELVRLSQMDPETASEQLYAGFQSMILAIRRSNLPVIAAIDGHAMGAGFDLALACDLKIASDKALLGQVWVKVGIIPGTGGAFWTSYLAGSSRASQMILTGDPVTAATAKEWGLINEVVPAGAVLARSMELASSIAANPPGAVAANKRAIDEVMRPDYEAALAYARQVQPERFGSTEFKDALAAKGRTK